MPETTVLLVEDNQTLLESIAFELEMRGYRVLQACDGRVALAVLEAGPLPNIIVSDIAMPEMDGYELLDAVRQRPEWEMLPFIFLTAFDSANSIRLGKSLGVDDYLTKPFEPEDLVTAMENKLKRMRQIQSYAARELDIARQQLVRLISHELRTPLTAIYGSAMLLEATLEQMPDENAQVLLTSLDSGTQRITRLVDRIVLFSQMQGDYLAGVYERHAGAVEVVPLVKRVLEACRARYANTTMPRVLVALPDDSPKVYGLREFVQMMVDELLDNAVKFSPPDGEVRLGVKVKDDKLVLRVKDTGRGIPPEKLADVWEAFTQLDRDVHEQQGMGIGLAMVQRCAAVHGGTCTMASQPGKGTVVSLELPLLPV